MSALVSILIPAHNAGPWLEQTLTSAVGQTWPSIEVIVVDDGSSDDTLAVARRFESRGVKVVSQANRGASAARNCALSLACGDYVQWLDADDLLAPDKIALQMQLAEGMGNHRTLISCAFGEFLADPRKTRFAASDLWADLAPVDFLLLRFSRNLWMNPSVWLMHRDLCQIAGPWDERLSLDDDGEYFARVVAASSGIRFVAQARCHYRRGHVGSLSRSLSDRACESLLLSLRLCIGQLLQIEDSERTRVASVVLLQNWAERSDCFLPDSPDRLQRLQSLAREVGGVVRPPRLS